MKIDFLSETINGIMGGGHGAGPSSVGPELEAVQQKAIRLIEQQRHNDNLGWYKKEWDTARLGSSCDPLMQEIIDGIEALALPLEVHMGIGYGWGYAALDQAEEYQSRLVKISNPALGHHLQFSIEHDGFYDFERVKHQTYGRVRGDLYWVDTERQGSYYNCKTFLKKQIAPLLLEHLGYNSIFGTAMWSINTAVKGNPNKDMDWRWRPSYSGLDSDLRPIYMSGLKKFYLCLGYVSNPNEIRQEQEGELHQDDVKSVNLMSAAAAQRTKEWLGDEAYDELTKYEETRLPEWRRITRAREAELGKEKLEAAKATVLSQLIKRQMIVDDMW
jgi:hypothetical protein